MKDSDVLVMMASEDPALLGELTDLECAQMVSYVRRYLSAYGEDATSLTVHDMVIDCMTSLGASVST